MGEGEVGMGLKDDLAAATPGPWSVHRDAAHFDTASDVFGGAEARGRGVSRQMMVSVGGFSGVPEQEANARVIAHAPDMAAALIEAEAALQITRDRLDIANHDSFDGVWSDDDFEVETREADAALARIREVMG